MSTRANDVVALRLQKLAWITNESDGLRWATLADLPQIVDIALNAFHWSMDPDVLQRLWVQKIALHAIAVLELDGRIRGFTEVLWGEDRWRPVLGVPVLRYLRETLARKLLCHKSYSADGPYLFITAVRLGEEIGTGARIFRTFQRHHEVVSIMYERKRTRLANYYKVLGFLPEENPLPLPLRLIVGRRYVYAKWRLRS